MVDWLSDGSYIQWVSEPSRRLTLDLWLAKDNRFLNLKSSYKRIMMAPPCRFINAMAIRNSYFLSSSWISYRQLDVQFQGVVVLWPLVE